MKSSVSIFGSNNIAMELALEYARNNCQVCIYSLDMHALLKVEDVIKSVMGNNNEISINLNQTLENIKIFHYNNAIIDGVEELSEARYVIVITEENLDENIKILHMLSEIVSENTIIFTNTLGMTVGKLSREYKFPNRLCGIQLMSRIFAMENVGIVKTILTDEFAIIKAEEMINLINKNVVILPDRPGFVIGKVLLMFIVEAMRIVEQQIASHHDIDKIIRLGMNIPKGPLQIADDIGLDIVHSSLNYIYEETKDYKYRPCKLLNDMVITGNLGRKSNKGFYNYD